MFPSHDNYNVSQSRYNLINAINEVEGKIGDLGDAFKTFTGSGVERLKCLNWTIK